MCNFSLKVQRSRVKQCLQLPCIMTGVLVLLLLCLSLRNGVVSSAKPNILLFLADDLGYGDLAAFGHPTSESPHLNKLLRESLLLTNFYAASPVCSPSRAALLTGLYPVTTGIWPGVLLPDSVGGLNESHITVASRLKVVGYYTAHIGKWHLGVGRQGEFLPTKRGFQRYLGVPYSHDMCPCDKCFPEEDGRCHGFCRQDSVGCPLFVNTNIYEQPVDLTTLTQKYTTAAVATIAHSINDLKVPFFLYMAYQHPHHPQFAGRTFRNATQRGSFGDSLAEMDASIGAILQKVSDLGAENNTLVIFTSDNGPSLARHQRGGCAGLLRCGKGTTWEGGVRVPALFRWKGVIPPGRSDHLMASMDIVPTLMSIVGNPLKAGVTHGHDVSKSIFLGHKSKRDSLAYFSEAPRKDVGILAVRYKNYKAHFFTQGNSLSDDSNYDYACRSNATLTAQNPLLLYDLDTDPGERYPLDADSLANFDQVARLMRRLRKRLTSSIKWGDSETNKGTSKEAFPCCSSVGIKCSPFPKCCNCHK